MSGAHHKTVSLRQKSAGEPDTGQLAIIRKYTLRDIQPDEIVVREYALAHNCIDRDNECFDEPLLADFARTLPGKGVFIKHPSGWSGDGGPGEGKVFAASVEQMTLEAAKEYLMQPDLKLAPDRNMVSVLKASAYFAKAPGEDAFRMKTDLGIVSDVSIGFDASSPERLKNSDGIELNAWRWKSPGEALEMSYVWLGAQPGARGTKSHAHRHEETDMELQQKYDQSQTELKAAKPKADQLDRLKTALGDNGALVDDVDGLAQLVTAGKSYRDSLVETIIKADRQDGSLADDEPSVAAARKEYAAMPMRALKSLSAKAEKAFENVTPGITGGDPNAGKPAPAAGGKDAEVPSGFGSKAFA